MDKEIIIGTRASALAQAQTRLIADAIARTAPHLRITIQTISTKGDTITDVPLAQIGGRGVFTKEIESALLDRQIDLAVHSLKDLSTELPDGLALGCVPKREDPHDALVTAAVGKTLADLAEGSIVGTSSVRRRAQLLAARPDLIIKDIRGNVDTRLRKLQSGDYDAIVLARAGINRLLAAGKLDPAVTDHLEDIDYELMLPSAGQGALAIELREGDDELCELLCPLHHQDTWRAVDAERQLLSLFGGGCSVPLGVIAAADSDVFVLRAGIAALDGSIMPRTEVHLPAEDWEFAAEQAHKDLMSQGAERILEELE